MSAELLLFILIVSALVLLSSATCSDLRTRRIPNALCLVLLGAGISIQYMITGLAGIVFALGAALVAFMLGLLAWHKAAIGGGDVKLLAACAALFGIPGSVLFLSYTALFAGLIALFMIFLGRLRRPGYAFGCNPGTQSIPVGGSMAERSRDLDRTNSIPLAPAVLAGALVQMHIAGWL